VSDSQILEVHARTGAGLLQRVPTHPDTLCTPHCWIQAMMATYTNSTHACARSRELLLLGIHSYDAICTYLFTQHLWMNVYLYMTMTLHSGTLAV
jgi:hypothetical protein